jgi:tight adherence protein C
MQLDNSLLPPILAAATVFLLCVGAGFTLLQRAARKARLRSAAGAERKNLLVQTQDGSDPTTERLRREVLKFMQASTGRMNLIKAKQVSNVRQRMIRAGFRNRDAIYVYIFLKVACPILLAGGVALFIGVLSPVSYPMLVQLLMVLGSGLLGSFVPDLLLRNLEVRRRTAIRKGLADALDLLVICAEAGLSLDAALSKVAEEMQRSARVLADELHYTCVELRFGDRRRAIENMSERIDLPAIRALSSTLIQTEKYGTPLSQAMRILAAEQRNERMMRAEEKAARLPAIMTVPLILFILPALFVVLMGPAVLRIMDNLLAVW